MFLETIREFIGTSLGCKIMTIWVLHLAPAHPSIILLWDEFLSGVLVDSQVMHF